MRGWRPTWRTIRFLEAADLGRATMRTLIRTVSIAALMMGASCGSRAKEARLTYFTYADAEVDALRSLEEGNASTIADLAACDDLMFESLSNHKRPDTEASRLYASCLV